MRVMTFNANGLRSALRHGFADWLKTQHVDVLCVQELRLVQADLHDGVRVLDGMPGWFHLAQKPGYSGTAIYTRSTPDAVVLGVEDEAFDAEGRSVEIRFDRGAQKFSILSVYFPSGTSGPERQAVKERFMAHMRTRLARLASEREVLLCGDVNIAHRELDLKNWRGNLDHTGFLPHERAWLDELFSHSGGGMVDVFRHLHPKLEQYTWWSQRGGARARNVGWRIDYHLATPRIAAQARQASVAATPYFSDHAPLTVDYEPWF